jgi:hypothetical protein
VLSSWGTTRVHKTHIIPWLSITGAYAARIIEKTGDAMLLKPLCEVGQGGILGHVELLRCQSMGASKQNTTRLVARGYVLLGT